MRRLTPQREEALRALLDDPSPVVRQALIRELSALGEAGLSFLQRLTSLENRLHRPFAEALLRELECGDPVTEFRLFIRSLNYELETGAILLNRTVDPDLDPAPCCLALDKLGERCLELMAPPMSSKEKCRVINRVLFHEEGFRGNADHYTDPANSFISRVLDSRKGIPISLSIIYILVAQRCHLSLETVGVPGHFLVGCYMEDTPFFIDPFERGAFRNAEEVFQMLRQNKIVPNPSYLTPTPVGEVLCRVCRNLVNHYLAAKNIALAKLFAGFVKEFENTYQHHAKS